MTPRNLLSRTALALCAAMLPLAAQTPLFNDGTAFGGSKVFSEGLNPLGNPARFDRSPSGWYLSYVDGDQRAKDNASILEDTLSTDAATTGAALKRLAENPWAIRIRAYGITGVKDSASFGYTREEYRSEYAHVDLANLGANLPLNQSQLDGRRVVVDRVHFGGGALASGTAAGFNVRLERWSMGVVAPYLAVNPDSTLPPPVPGAFPFPYSANDYVMRFSTTTARTLTYALDAGFTTELAEGLRVGAMVDQINAKRLWDVNMKPRIRASLQIDLGPSTQLTAETDLNAVQRMPFPVNQKSSAASLRYQVSQAVVFLLGAERRKIEDSSTTVAGVTLQLRTPSLLVSFGFQAGQDRPLKGLALMVN